MRQREWRRRARWGRPRLHRADYGQREPTLQIRAVSSCWFIREVDENCYAVYRLHSPFIIPRFVLEKTGWHSKSSGAGKMLGWQYHGRRAGKNSASQGSRWKFRSTYLDENAYSSLHSSIITNVLSLKARSSSKEAFHNFSHQDNCKCFLRRVFQTTRHHHFLSVLLN